MTLEHANVRELRCGKEKERKKKKNKKIRKKKKRGIR